MNQNHVHVRLREFYLELAIIKCKRRPHRATQFHSDFPATYTRESTSYHCHTTRW
jgi:hypothetical protein